MRVSRLEAAPRAALTCTEVPPSRQVGGLHEDVRAGLLAPPRRLPPKYFYDARGSALFERICEQPEYYPTRAEMALLERHAGQILARVRPDRILELGSGSPRKVRYLLDACQSARCRPCYAPFDVCREVLIESGRELTAEYPWLYVDALVGDYCAGLEHLPDGAGRDLIVFLGGTIGNFPAAERTRFLAELRALMDRDDRLLIGADRVKAPQVLHAAYNDAEGVTAAFNLNLLEVLNRELGADFDLGRFHHYACYNPRQARVEMYLVTLERHTVRLPAMDATLELEEGEHILTELSCKFTLRALEEMLDAAGFAIDAHYQGDDGYFSLVLARAA